MKSAGKSGAENFGVMVSCYRGDLPLLKGCLASIKQAFPSLPICLVTHGSFDVDDLKNTYDLQVLREEDVDPRLRAQSYGYGLTKMVSFWHSPFERFVHIDADAVCWGDFLDGIDISAQDFVYNEPHEFIDEHIQRTQYFDPTLIDVGFDWRACPFFNTGVFIARRGMLDLDDYLALLAHQRSVSGSIFTDQGILNLLVFRYAKEGKISIRQWPLQVIVPIVPVADLHRDYRIVDNCPRISDSCRRLIHWAGPKPLLIERHPFTEPMTYFRLQHLKRVGSPMARLGKVGLLFEETSSRITRRHQGSYVLAARSKMRWLFGRLLPRGRNARQSA